ncbi:hypothetical protein ACN42_g7088 [Penicillium freii]|uniref:MARVEL domain-containing protein n=1 Tax=Penicillium freii TaxID=48697 RepID=A0A101MGE9_PENFR|nr:hypothetical protein ACN42_g7088 [Penicillium freii]
MIIRLLVVNTHLLSSWLTAFIFLALNFNHVSCSVHPWNRQTVCSRKYSAEAFSLIAFFATLTALAFEILYTYLPKNDTPVREKPNGVTHLENNLRGAGVMSP